MPGVVSSRRRWFAAAFTCGAATFVLDAQVELGVATAVAYVATVGLVFLSGSRRSVWITAVLCSVLTVVGLLVSPPSDEFWKILANRGLAWFAIWVTAVLCLRVLSLLAEQHVRADTAEKLAAEVKRRGDEGARRSLAMSSIMEDLRLERAQLRAEIGVRQQAEASLAKLAAIVDCCDDAILGKTLDGIVTSWNRGAESLYGYTAEEMIGQPISRIVPLERAEEVPRFLEQLQRGEAIDQWETVRIHKDGTRRWVSLTISPIRDASGNVVGASTIARDISERIELLENLRASEHFARSTLDSLVCFAGVCTLDGVLIEANQPALAIGGLRKEDLGRPVAETSWWSHDEDVQAQLRAAIAKAAAGELSRYDVQVRVAEGQLITMAFQIVPLNNERGERTHLILSGFDVTDRVRYEQQLEAAKEQAEKASRAKSQFLASMSHELRTPLNGVLGMAELLAGTELSNKQQQYVEACRNSGESLLSLINDILDLSKIESGKLELDVHEFDLEALVTDTVDTMAWRAMDKNLEMPCRIDHVSRFMLQGDSHRLRQVLVNLLGNAIKFTDSGEIVVRTECVGRQDDQITVRFSITDTGIGIPANKLDRLFHSFSQIDASTTRKYGGTGLGLAISQSLVRLMGGDIAIESEVGVGSTFSFEVPFNIASQSTDAPSGRSPLAGLHSLIVDDNHTNRIILAEYAAEWGLSSVVAASVDEALAAVQAADTAGAPFRLLLTDYHMPEKNGLDLARSLKGGRQLIVLLLGSTDIHLNAQELQEHGVHATLRKPIRRRELHDVLCGLMGGGGGRATRPTSAAPPPPPPTPRLPALQILLAEDNKINQMYLLELMKQLNCTCDTVANGREATLAVQESHYDLVLMDCQMPQMDGFEATRKIRAMESDGTLTGHLPIVALTANAVKGDRERCLAAGMDEYLSKPVQKSRIVAVLEELFRDALPQEATEDHPSAGPDEPAGRTTADPINAEALLSRCFGNVAFAESLLEQLEEMSSARLEEIREALQREDAAAVAAAAHSLKGAAGILCATGMQELTADIERAALSSDLETVSCQLEELRVEVSRCLAGVPEVRRQWVTGGAGT